MARAHRARTEVRASRPGIKAPEHAWLLLVVFLAPLDVDLESAREKGQNAQRMAWSEWQDSNLRPLRPERGGPYPLASFFNSLVFVAIR